MSKFNNSPTFFDQLVAETISMEDSNDFSRTSFESDLRNKFINFRRLSHFSSNGVFRFEVDQSKVIDFPDTWSIFSELKERSDSFYIYIDSSCDIDELFNVFTVLKVAKCYSFIKYDDIVYFVSSNNFGEMESLLEKYHIKNYNYFDLSQKYA